ncbi:MAG: hypothetical protein A2X94_13405 [Bdellovibrionales bacterium GWB1_55_8]|nr:MAG: hypothetical protein A2X94_13405 [Bdellovibrionales bacterium GWB1_55_8]
MRRTTAGTLLGPVAGTILGLMLISPSVWSDAIPAPTQTEVAEAQIQKLSIGQSETTVTRLMGPPRNRVAQKSGAILDYEQLLLRFKNGRLAEIDHTLVPPKERGALIPGDLPLVELPRERSEDTVLPGRWVTHPQSGRIWVIGVSGKVERVLVRPAWKVKTPGLPIHQLLDRPPPGENNQVRRRK